MFAALVSKNNFGLESARPNKYSEKQGIAVMIYKQNVEKIFFGRNGENKIRVRSKPLQR